MKVGGGWVGSDPPLLSSMKTMARNFGTFGISHLVGFLPTPQNQLL